MGLGDFEPFLGNVESFEEIFGCKWYFLGKIRWRNRYFLGQIRWRNRYFLGIQGGGDRGSTFAPLSPRRFTYDY